MVESCAGTLSRAGAQSCQGAYMAYTFCSVCHLALYQLDTVHGPVNVCETCDPHTAHLLPTVG